MRLLVVIVSLLSSHSSARTLHRSSTESDDWTDVFSQQLPQKSPNRCDADDEFLLQAIETAIRNCRTQGQCTEGRSFTVEERKDLLDVVYDWHDLCIADNRCTCTGNTDAGVDKKIRPRNDLLTLQSRGDDLLTKKFRQKGILGERSTGLVGDTQMAQNQRESQLLDERSTGVVNHVQTTQNERESQILDVRSTGLQGPTQIDLNGRSIARDEATAEYMCELFGDDSEHCQRRTTEQQDDAKTSRDLMRQAKSLATRDEPSSIGDAETKPKSRPVEAFLDTTVDGFLALCADESYCDFDIFEAQFIGKLHTRLQAAKNFAMT